MKNTILKIFLGLVGFLVAIIFYVNSSYFIKNQQWKYGEGTHIGDWLEKSNFEIND